MREQGWYQDPYGSHGQRYVSEGRPTWLVRDGDVESYDPPTAHQLSMPVDAWQPAPEPLDEWDEPLDEPAAGRPTWVTALVIFLSVFTVLFLVFGLYVIVGISNR
jgi:hypothetical protein